MFSGVLYLLKFVWKKQPLYIILSILYQFVSSLIPLSAIIIPKFIIDELMTLQRISYLVLYISILVFVNALGGILNTFLQNKCFELKGKIFVDFQAMITERLSMCDFENLEDPNFLDIREKAKKFLFANGQGFGVVMDNTFNIIGKLFVFLGIIGVLLQFNILIVLLFSMLVVFNTLFEARVKKSMLN